MASPPHPPHDADAVQRTLPSVGDVVEGKYRIKQLIGRGGMGAVFLAYHEGLQHDVAMKVLLPDVARDGRVVTRFLNEARAAARLKNEHVAKVMDVGQLDNGSAYMTLEYLEGIDLHKLLLQRGALPVAEAVGYALQALEGVAHAHAHGIVHRDLKPANLFVMRRYDGAALIKVLDFGIAKAVHATAAEGIVGITGTQAQLGSPAFMSPEQIRSSKHVDARTDLWSMGVVLYRMLTNAPPFDGTNPGAVFAQILEQPPTPMAKYRDDVPTALENVVLRCLARDPNARWASAADLAVALVPFATVDAGKSARRISRALKGLPASPIPTSSPGVQAVPAPTEARGGKGWIVALVGTIVAGGAAVAFVVTRPAPATTSEAPSSATPTAPASSAERGGEPASAAASATASAQPLALGSSEPACPPPLPAGAAPRATAAAPKPAASACPPAAVEVDAIPRTRH